MAMPADVCKNQMCNGTNPMSCRSATTRVTAAGPQLYWRRGVQEAALAVHGGAGGLHEAEHRGSARHQPIWDYFLDVQRDMADEGWGAIEYGSVGHASGQVVGGPAKPLQYFLPTIFAEVMTTCSKGSGLAGDSDPFASDITWGCYAKNDSPRAFNGVVTVTAIDFASGEEAAISTVAASMPAGVGQTMHFGIAGVPNATSAILRAMVKDGTGAEVSSNLVPMIEPHRFAIANASVQFSIKEAANEDGSIDIVMTSGKVAVYVTFTTLTQGRFSDNVFLMKPGTKAIQFLPIAGYFVRSELASSLRVEHLASYIL